MTTDYANKEREFLESLKADTGRDLDEWMAEIAAQNLPHRNDVIDWLRHQGFIFSWASWLERIYHNNGQPIYLETVPEPAPDTKKSAPSLRLVHSAPAPSTPPSTQDPNPKPPAPASSQPVAINPKPIEPPDPDLQVIFAKAKAYAPLAAHVIKRIQATIPEVKTVAKRSHVEVANPEIFAILIVAATGLRLILNLGEQPIVDPLEKARAPNPTIRLPANMTHMLTLTDARNVNTTFDDLIKQADQHVNGS